MDRELASAYRRCCVCNRFLGISRRDPFRKGVWVPDTDTIPCPDHPTANVNLYVAEKGDREALPLKKGNPMDHPDVTHAERTGYPEGGEPEIWTGMVDVIITVGIDIDADDTCHDEAQAKAEAIKQVRQLLRNPDLAVDVIETITHKRERSV